MIYFSYLFGIYYAAMFALALGWKLFSEYEVALSTVFLFPFVPFLSIIDRIRNPDNYKY